MHNASACSTSHSTVTTTRARFSKKGNLRTAVHDRAERKVPRRPALKLTLIVQSNVASKKFVRDSLGRIRSTGVDVDGVRDALRVGKAASDGREDVSCVSPVQVVNIARDA